MARTCLGNSPLGLAQDHQSSGCQYRYAIASGDQPQAGLRKRRRAVAAATARLAFPAAIG